LRPTGKILNACGGRAKKMMGAGNLFTQPGQAEIKKKKRSHR
jgi:hypothetical protein